MMILMAVYKKVTLTDADVLEIRLPHRRVYMVQTDKDGSFIWHLRKKGEKI